MLKVAASHMSTEVVEAEGSSMTWRLTQPGRERRRLDAVQWAEGQRTTSTTSCSTIGSLCSDVTGGIVSWLAGERAGVSRVTEEWKHGTEGDLRLSTED